VSLGTRQLVERLMDAFEATDAKAILSLLVEDDTLGSRRIEPGGSALRPSRSVGSCGAGSSRSCSMRQSRRHQKRIPGKGRRTEMADDHANQSLTSEHRRLEALVGKWHTTGQTHPTPSAPGLQIDAEDTYEWIPGGFGLLVIVDARVGDKRVEGAEIIGYDPLRDAYITLYVGSDGPTSYEARLAEREGDLVWSMHSERNRFTGVFDEEGPRSLDTGRCAATTEAGVRGWTSR
jgi:Protein of unknown function (DUF1579)